MNQICDSASPGLLLPPIQCCLLSIGDKVESLLDAAQQLSLHGVEVVQLQVIHGAKAKELLNAMHAQAQAAGKEGHIWHHR